MRISLRTRAFSLMLTILMVFAMLPISVGASAAPAATPEPVIADFSTEESYNSYMNPFDSGYNSGFVGTYAYDQTEGALKLTYTSDSLKNGKFCKYTMQFDAGKGPTAAQPYIVVTYKTTSTEAVALTLENYVNTAATKQTLAADISLSRGEYIRTAPVKLNDANLARITGTSNAFLNLVFNVTNASSVVYIKEIAFFSSAEEACAYYPTIIKTDSIQHMTRDVYVYDSPSGDTHDLLVNHTYGENVGKYKFIEVEHRGEKENVLSLMKGSLQAGGLYRVLLWSKTGRIPLEQRYMTVKYRTNYEGTATLRFRDYSNSGGNMLIASDISVSDGEWTFTAPIKINDPLWGRMVGYNGVKPAHNVLVADIPADAPADTYFYISEIDFFVSEAAATAYIEANTPRPEPEAAPKISVAVDGMPEEGYIGDTLTLDVKLTSDKPANVNALSFALNYDADKLTFVSLTPADSIGGEAVTNEEAFAWFSSTGINITDTETTVATAVFKVKEGIADGDKTTVIAGDNSNTVLSVKVVDASDAFVPTAVSSDEITLYRTNIELFFITAAQYRALAAGTKILAIKADSNDKTFALDEYNFCWSEKYSAYLAIVDAELTEDDVISDISHTKTADPDVIAYKGDVNGDGYVTAGDAAEISEMLHDPDNARFTDAERLAADVFGTYTEGSAYVTIADAMWTLYASVGLNYEGGEIEPEPKPEEPKPEEPETYTGLVIPMTSFTEADKTLYIYQTANCPEGKPHSFGDLPGTYSFSTKENALSLEYNSTKTYHGNHRYHVAFDASNSLWDNAYVVVTYRTDVSTAGTKLRYVNGASQNDNVVLASDVSVSGGKYVFSTPVNINTDGAAKDMLDRQQTAMNNVLSVEIPADESNAYFYVKEIAFFPTVEDAETYMKLTKLPEVDLSTVVIPTTSFKEADKKLAIYATSDIPNGVSHTFGDNAGKYSFDPLEGALLIKNSGANYMSGYYRYHLKFDSKTTLTNQTWMVVTYRTNYTGSAAMTLASNSSPSDKVTLASDVSVSGDKYVYSTPVNLDTKTTSGDLFDRISKDANHNALVVSFPQNTPDNIYFYIKEFAFFDSEAAALAYVASNPLPEASSDTYTKFDLYDLATAKEKLIVYNNSHVINGDALPSNLTVGQTGEYRFNDDQQALEILETWNNIANDYHNFHFITRGKNMVRENETFMVIMYRTNVTTAGAIRFRNNGWTSNVATLDSNLTKSNDKWVFSTPVNINAQTHPSSANLFGRVRNGTLTPIIVDIPLASEAAYSPSQYFFIKEVLFFSSEAAANRYIENAKLPEATEVVYGKGLSKDQWIDPISISFASADKTAVNATAEGDFTYVEGGAKLTGTVKPQFKADSYLQKNHVLMTVSYKTTAAGTLKLGDTVIAADTSVSAGEWTFTDVFVLTDDIKAAFGTGTANSITYTGEGELIIGEIVFISGEGQLLDYVSEFDKPATGSYYDGKLGTFKEISVQEGEGLGKWTYNEEDRFTLTKSPEEKYGSDYRMTYNFVNRDEILDKPINTKPYNDRNLTHFFMRVVYKADNGSGDDVSLITVNPKSDISVIIEDDIQDTNGQWVLSDAVRVPNDILNALSGTGVYERNHNEELYHLPAVLAFTNTEDDASYGIKNIYFFKTAADAINFTMPADPVKPVSVYNIGGTVSAEPVYTTKVDSTLAANTYKIYVENGTLYVTADSTTSLGVAEAVAKLRVLGGDRFEDIVNITLASDFVLTGSASVSNITETVNLKYDDRYTFDKPVAMIISHTITSTDVMTGEADVSVLKRTDGETFAASAIGGAYVYFTDGTGVSVTVTPASLSVIMMIGQSNTEGYDGDYRLSIRNKNGQVYSTYASAGYRYIAPVLGTPYRENNGTDVLTVYNPGVFVPKSLTTDITHTGNVAAYKLDMLNEGASGKGGMDSAIAYEWNRQTGDKVWMVNVAHSGSNILSWTPGDGFADTNYWQSVGVMKLVLETVKAEIAAGHYTYSQMGYFWLQGCSDLNRDAASYNENYLAMFEGYKRDLAFDHDGDASTADKTLDFGGILIVRCGGNTINKPEDFYMNGPRTSQYLLGNTANNGIYLVSNISDYWRTDADVANYFTNKYGTAENFKESNADVTYNMPSTIKDVHPGIHYSQAGYNELGRDAVHNLLRQMGIVTPETTAVTFKLMDANGVVTDFAANGVTLAAGASVVIVPDAAPRYLAASVNVTTSANITRDGFYTFTSTDGKAGTITFTCGEASVTVNVN